MSPIERFSDFEAAREAQWLQPGDPLLLAKIRQVWELGQRLAVYPPPLGTWFFRSIEEANAHREAWTTERVRRLSEERAGADGRIAGLS